MKALLAAGADVNAKDYLSQTALVNAARRGHVKRLQVLMTAGADVNKHYNLLNDRNTTDLDKMECSNALINAVAGGNIQCVKLLIKAGACVNKIGHEIHSPLQLAIVQHNVTCADLLIKAGASVNGGDIFTPLYDAVMNKAHQCLNLLLRSGADVHDTGIEGLIVLMVVQDEECCRLLLKHHTQINRRYPNGDNALTRYMVDVHRINKEVCSLIFAAGETAPETVERWYQPDKPINTSDYLPQINIKFDLKYLCRTAIRKHLLRLDMYMNLFDRVPRLGLPKSYCTTCHWILQPSWTVIQSEIHVFTTLDFVFELKCKVYWNLALLAFVEFDMNRNVIKTGDILSKMYGSGHRT